MSEQEKATLKVIGPLEFKPGGMLVLELDKRSAMKTVDETVWGKFGMADVIDQTQHYENSFIWKLELMQGVKLSVIAEGVSAALRTFLPEHVEVVCVGND